MRREYWGVRRLAVLELGDRASQRPLSPPWDEARSRMDGGGPD